ncbi:hypothetical protein ACHAXT_011116 [Thalassiosira profunda]
MSNPGGEQQPGAAPPSQGSAVVPSANTTPAHTQPNTPQISPHTNQQIAQPTQHAMQPVSQQAAPQVLQPVPQQQLFHQASQQNVVSPQQQQGVPQHVILQPQMMAQQQLQQTQYQQQAPVAMLQTPLLQSTGPSPQKGVQKGRFRVVKPGAGGDGQSVASSGDGAENAPAVSAVKKGRFMVKKGASAKDVQQAKTGKDATGEPTNQSPKGKGGDGPGEDAALSPPPADTITKKKGRFLVKTGNSTQNLAAMEQEGAGDSSNVAELGSKPSGAAEVETEKCKPGDGGETVQRRPSLLKKKGRFVVKTGGTGSATNSPRPKPSSAGGSATNSPRPMPPSAEAARNALGGISQHFPFAPANPQGPYAAANLPLQPGVAMATPMLDANGQMVLVSIAQPMQQPPLQPQLPPAQLQAPPQFVSPPVQGSAPTPPPPAASDAQPVPRPRALTDERSQSVPVAAKSNIPRPIRAPGSSGSGNWANLKGGKGRMVGGGGVGKVLHYLDTLRSEVVDADKSIVSLHSDNRFLRDKNKELEAKHKDLERRLAEEKRLRKVAEAKYQSLIEQVREQEVDQVAGSGSNGVDQEAPSSDETGRVAGQSLTSQPSVATAPEELVLSGATFSSPSEKQQSELEKASGDNSDGRASKKPLNNPPVAEASLDHQQLDVCIGTPSFDAMMGSTSSKSPGPDAKHPKSQNNSLNSADPSQTALTALSPNQFDPLGTPAQQTDVAIGQNVAIPLIVTTVSPNPVVSAVVGDVRCSTPHISNKKHFDPLGTPERQASGGVKNTLPSMVTNGIPQMPAMATQLDNGNVAVPVVVPVVQRQPPQQPATEQTEADPFDEIVARSHGNGAM